MAHFIFEFIPKSLGRRYKCDLVVPSLNLHGALSNANPSYYQERTKAFPLFVFLGGFGEDKECWQTNCHIVELAEKHQFAALFVEGENSWYLNRGPLSNYEKLIDEDLLDFVYGNFANLSKEAPLGIIGESMGGYGALTHYLRHTDLYNVCVALSPATRPDQLNEAETGGTLKDAFLSHKGEKLSIYLSVGDKDFIIQASKEFDAWLHENHIDAAYRYVPGADHSWTTWREEIDRVIRFLQNKGFIS